MPHRIEVLAHKDDGRALNIKSLLAARGLKADIRVLDVYSSESEAIHNDAFTSAVCNPVTQQLLTTRASSPTEQRDARGSGANNNEIPAQGGDDDIGFKFNYALEIGFLPGVTDNVGHTATELLELAGANDTVYSSRAYLVSGEVSKDDIQELVGQLANTLIQRANIMEAKDFITRDIIIPQVNLTNQGTAADEVDLNVSDTELETIGTQGIANDDGSRRGPLGMSLHYMKAVQDYFKKEGRNPKDIELEMLAQSWSEHCKHTIFASPIDEIKDGLYKHYIKRATKEIREARGENDICVSVFSDNAGGIIFDDEYLITDKVETHNSPSALDPFGGSITGIVGVNRDCIGFGLGAKPVINRYGFCLADPKSDPKYFRDKDLNIPILSPENIMNGVIAGVESGGNCSGIPTPQGFVTFDDRFVGKPLVFVGTIGLIPRDIDGRPGHEKCAQPGDRIIVAGGRVGRDGIHGATFSSVALDEGSPATAVQIGDPITQKKMSDAIIKELRDQNLYSAITDNGAGGISSSVGEMAEQSGGLHVELEKVPLKYPGMAPWEIWISESQERMTLAVPPENVEKIISHFAKRGVEATDIGEYTDSGRAVVTWNGETIMDMDMDFIHDGLPETPLKTTFTRGGEDEPRIDEPSDHAALLLDLLARPNIATKEFISTQYDHNVQGTAIMGPLQGPGRVFTETTITAPVLTSEKGVVLSQGLFPRYSDIDTHDMARAGLDFAVRNAVAAGCDFTHLALLDNICWCSSDEPERLGQLKRAMHGIYHLARSYGAPFISGKDSMFNDFKGYDENAEPVKISSPPTVLISSIGVIPHVDQAIDLAPKAVGDCVYLLGETKDECGAGEYYDHLGYTGNNVPETKDKANNKLYITYSRAARKRLISSALALGMGGLGVALAKKAIAGQMGLDIDLSKIGSKLRSDKLLYSESTGRILVTVAPQNKKAFEKMFKNVPNVYEIGHIAYTDKLNINSVLEVDIKILEKAYKGTFEDYS